jgi:hypothetical protein
MLEYFVCSNVTGTIPTELGSLRSLIVWGTSKNQVTGPFPSELAGMTALEEFVVSDNYYIVDRSHLGSAT